MIMQLITSITLLLLMLAHCGNAVPVLHPRMPLTIIDRVTCQIAGVRIADPVAELMALGAGSISSPTADLSNNEFAKLLRQCISASSEDERNRFPGAEDYGLGANPSIDGAAPSNGDSDTAGNGAARSNIAAADTTDTTSNAAPADTNNSANSSTASTDATGSTDNNASAPTAKGSANPANDTAAPADSGDNSTNNSANNSSPAATTSNIAADSSTSASSSSSGTGSDNSNSASGESNDAGTATDASASAASASGDTSTAPAPANDPAPAANNSDGDTPFNPDEAPADPYAGAGYAPSAAYALAGDTSSPADAPAPASDDPADAFLSRNRQQTVSENGCTGVLCTAESTMGVGVAPELGMTGLREGNPRGCPNGAVGACVDTK